MSDFTPGPWTLHDEGEGCYDIRPDGGSPPIATVGWHEDDHESAANARLICAAPEMLAALEEVFGLLVERNPGFSTIGLDKRIRAALASARGVRP